MGGFWVYFEGRADGLEVGSEGKRQVKACGLSTWKDEALGGKGGFGG